MKRISTFLFMICSLAAWAQSPDKISYQAVVRNSSNALVSNSAVGMRISIVQGSIFGASVYVETHTISTNANGLVSIEIGSGTVINGSMASINWANGPYFIKTETDPTGGSNYTITGTSQLLSVPYALYAKRTGFDGDSSAVNELQTLTKVGNNIILSNGGGTVTLPTGSGGTDGDTSATNEIQTVSKTGNTVTLSNGGGNFTVDDNDANPTNEIQTISKTGSMVTLSNGGGSFSVDDNDASPTNEIQTVSKTGNTVTLSNGGGSFSVDDGDTSTSNELQTISRSGNTVTLSNGGGTFSVAEGDTTYWKKTSSGNHIYFNQGHLGIGLSSPSFPFHLSSTCTLTSVSGVYTAAAMDFTGGSTNTNTYYGLRLNLTASDGLSQGIRSTVLGSTTAGSTGVYGRTEASTLLNRGIQGHTSGTGLYNQGVFGRSDGTGDASGNSQNMGCFGYATNNSNYNFGVAGQSDGSSGVNYGVWGYATGGSANYAGYFEGNVTVTGTFSNPSDMKLKKNINDLESPLSKLMKLKVKSYEYIIDSNITLPQGLQFGFIAQDMEILFPQLVKNQVQARPGIEGQAPVVFEYKAINYIGMIPVLTKAIQEQQQLIEQLMQRIALLESQR